MIQNNYNPNIYLFGNPFWATKKSLSFDFDKFKLMFELYQNLPENIKLVAIDQESADIIWQIGQKNKFSENQISTLAIIVWKLLSAQMPIAQFIPSITQELQIPAEIARAIAQEINVKIFSKAALQIKRLQETRFANPESRNPNPEQSRIPNPEIRNPKSETRNPKPEIRSDFVPQVRRPEERVVNLQKRIDEKPRFVEAGPKIEGNIVDLSS